MAHKGRQEQAGGLAGGGGGIERIDGKWAAQQPHMQADLVGFASLGEASDEAVRAEGFFQIPGGAGGLAMAVEGHFAGAAIVGGDGGVDEAIGFGRSAVDQREVFLFHEIILELMGKMALGGQVLGQQQYAGGVFVEAMDDTQARVVRSGPGELQLSGEFFDE